MALKDGSDFGELLNDVEILRSGNHVASNGREVTLTDADLDRLAENYSAGHHEAPVVIGHPAENGPAYGWVKGLKRVGDRLTATLDLVPEFLEALRQGLYKKRSASIYADLDGLGPYLRHVGFLGAQPPAIKALADINLRDGGESLTIDYKEESPMSWKDKVKGLFSQAVDEIPEETKVVIAHPPKDQPARFSEEDVKKRETEAAEAAAKKARDEALAEFSEQQRQKDLEAQRAQHKSQMQAKVEDLVTRGKALPAWVKSGLVEFMQSLGWDEAVSLEFSDADGKPLKKTPQAWFLEFLEGLPKLVPLGEFAGKDKDTGTEGAGVKLAELTRAKLEKQPELGYSMAFAEVQREHPDLAAAYVQELR